VHVAPARINIQYSMYLRHSDGLSRQCCCAHFCRVVYGV